MRSRGAPFAREATAGDATTPLPTTASGRGPLPEGTFGGGRCCSLSLATRCAISRRLRFPRRWIRERESRFRRGGKRRRSGNRERRLGSRGPQPDSRASTLRLRVERSVPLATQAKGDWPTRRRGRFLADRSRFSDSGGCDCPKRRVRGVENARQLWLSDRARQEPVVVRVQIHPVRRARRRERPAARK